LVTTSLQISEDFKEIFFKLRERTNAIEDLMEQREFIKGVPEVVATHSVKIDQAMSDYDMIDEYYFTLSDEDFNNR
jgi:dynein heavy chain